METVDGPDTFAGINKSDLKCALCSKPYNKPKYLDCLHYFCLKCLKNWVKKNNGVLKCPTCHATHEVPEGGVQKFPTNGVMRGLVDHMTSLGKADPQLCSNCTNEAGHYCTDCDYFYCEACTNLHMHAKQTSMHTVITLVEYKNLGPFKQLATKQLNCKDHNMNLKLYCEKCKKSVCFQCATVEHKSQEHVIKEGTQAFKEFITKASEQLTMSEAKESNLGEIEEKLKSTQASLLGNKEHCRTAVEDHFGSLQKLLDAQKQERLRELDEIFDKDIELKKDQLEEIDSTKIQLGSTRELIKILMKSPNISLTLMNSDMISSRIDTLLAFQMNADSTHSTWKFFPVNTVQEQLQHGHIGKIKYISPALSTIDNVEDVRIFVGEKLSVTLTTKDNDGEVCYDEPTKVTAKMTSTSGEENILEVTDNKNASYEVHGTCTAAGEWMLSVLIDSQCIRGSPWKMNVVKSGFQSVTDLRDFCNHGELHNINVIDKAIFACFSRNRNIAKICKGGIQLIDLGYLRGAKVLSLCGGISGEIVLACHDSNKGRILVCKQDGTFVKEFDNLTIGRVQGMMVNKDDQIYIPDNDRNCVLKVSLSGELLAKIPSESRSDVLKFPKGVAIMEDGSLLVCSYWNNQVVMFDKNGVFVKVFVDTGEDIDGKVYSPYSVAVDKQGNVVVGSLQRLQLFSKDGQFIKRIDDNSHVLHCPGSIICRRRQVIIADKGNASVCVYNY
ncbi:tripartite motif-containing protein 2-like [Anneissia japonica]|uniref:tripartite motif-containing protein 2-like n=1 Tax=Anneissia japonica TaxID=1529436 RepID=UPI00142584AB|nr:tripartite motif-containing protein 2-like [Anneissia japonica]